MTQAAHKPRAIWVGTGTRGPFTLQDEDGADIYVESISQIQGIRYASVTATTGTPLTPTTDFTATGLPGSAPAITLTMAQDVLASGERIVWRRVQPYSQELDLDVGGDLPSTSIETRLDKLLRQVQEVQIDAAQAFRRHFTETSSPMYPAPASRASKLASYDESGNPVALTGTDFLATLATLTAEIAALYAIRADIEQVADIDAEIASLEGIKTELLALYASLGNINTVGDALDDGTIDDLLDGQVAKENTLSALKARPSPANNETVKTLGRASVGDGGGGTWRWSDSDISTEVSSDPEEGCYAAPTGEDGSSGGWIRVRGKGLFFAEWWGCSTALSDNSAELQSAIDFAGSEGGGTILCQTGDYKFTDSVTCTENNVSIKAVTPFATAFRVGVNIGDSFLKVGNGAGAVTNYFGLEGIRFEFHSNAQTVGAALALEKCFNPIIRNCVFIGYPGKYMKVGVKVDGYTTGDRHFFENVRVTQCSTHNWLIGQDSIPRAVYMRRCYASAGGSSGFTVRSVTVLGMIECEANGNVGPNLQIYPNTSGQTAQWIDCTNCNWDTGEDHNVYIDGSTAGATVYAVKFDHCRSLSAAKAGYFIKDAEVALNEPTITNNNEEGIELAGTSVDLTVNGGRIYDNSRSGSGTFNSIKIGTSKGRVTLADFDFTADEKSGESLYSIASVADAGGGDITITTTGTHSIDVDDTIIITGTAHIDGTYRVKTTPTGTTLTIEATFVATEAVTDAINSYSVANYNINVPSGFAGLVTIENCRTDEFSHVSSPAFNIDEPSACKIRDVEGFVTRNKFTITYDQSVGGSQSFPHGLDGTPDINDVIILPKGDTEGRRFWRQTPTATDVKIVPNAVPSVDLDFTCIVSIYD